VKWGTAESSIIERSAAGVPKPRMCLSWDVMRLAHTR